MMWVLPLVRRRCGDCRKPFICSCTRVPTTPQMICHPFIQMEASGELNTCCSLTSLDGYSTIDQRDKDCKYKAGDGSVDLTEREPLKVRADLCWPPGGRRGHGGWNNDVSVKRYHMCSPSFLLSPCVLRWSSLAALNPIDSRGWKLSPCVNAARRSSSAVDGLRSASHQLIECKLLVSESN